MQYPPILDESFHSLPVDFEGYNLLCCQKKYKIVNCSPGPTQIPHEVLDNMKEDMFVAEPEYSYGITPLEISHRSPEFNEIMQNVNKKLRTYMKIPKEFTILWTRGGGHGQFAAIPLNLQNIPDVKGNYVVTGSWSSRAYQESTKFVRSRSSTEEYFNGFIPLQYNTIPRKFEVDKDDTYLYLCSNETINGTEFREDGIPYPTREERENNLLVVDMSSDFGMKEIDWRKIDVAFACTSKNFGVSGANITIIRKNVLEKIKDINSYANNIPGVLDWNLYEATDSLYNTPAIFNIYLIEKLLDYYVNSGGITTIEKQSKEKARLVYDILDSSELFHAVISDDEIRSNINIPFLIGDGSDSIRSKFLVFCYQHNIIGLRTKTPFKYSAFQMKEPLRISLYNGISIDDVSHICNVMKKFEELALNSTEKNST